jgi:hypothetical protein
MTALALNLGAVSLGLRLESAETEASTARTASSTRIDKVMAAMIWLCW